MKAYFAMLLLPICFILSSCMTTPNMHQVVTTPLILTPPPPDQAPVLIPKGYRNCIWTESKFKNGIWIPSHQVCTYRHKRYWTAAHWRCTFYLLDEGRCTQWQWRQGKWHR